MAAPNAQQQGLPPFPLGNPGGLVIGGQDPAAAAAAAAQALAGGGAVGAGAGPPAPPSSNGSYPPSGIARDYLQGLLANF
jgi:hypothetical protein